MNWLREFIDYKENCPICATQLEVGLISSKFRAAIVSDNTLKIPIKINTIPKNKYDSSCSAELHLHVDTLTFDVMFFDELGIEKDKAINLAVIESFKNVLMMGPTQQQSPILCYLSKRCACKKYQYQSTTISLIWNKAQININPEPISIERFSICYKTRLMEVFNYPLFEKTEIYYGAVIPGLTNSSIKEMTQTLDPMLLPSSLQVPLIKFINMENFIKSLETLIIFS